MITLSKIKVNVFGGLSVWEEGMEEPRHINLAGRSKRLWMLAMYLILNREQEIPAQRLIDMFWPEGENDNPMSTLQNNISRVRSTLASIGISDAKNRIRYSNGCYQWVDGENVEVDAEQFDSLAKQAGSQLETDEELDTALRALELYRGDFLPELTFDIQYMILNTYYRSTYMRLCRETARRLLEMNRLEDAERICRAGIEIDPTVEDIVILLMRAMTRAGNPHKALELYDDIAKLYKKTYGVTPSAELEMERAVTASGLYGQDVTEKDIISFLHDGDMGEGAFYCDNRVFREIVQLHVRQIRRNGTPSQMAIIGLAPDEGRSAEQQAVHMKCLRRVLTSALRTGDPFTQMSAKQFLVLLPGAKQGDATVVMNRMVNRFKTSYPYSAAKLKYQTVELERLIQLNDAENGRQKIES